MYENSEADGNIDKAAISVSPDGAPAWFATPPLFPCSRFIWSLLKWTNSRVRAIRLSWARAYFGHVEGSSERSPAKCTFTARLLASAEEHAGNACRAVFATQCDALFINYNLGEGADTLPSNSMFYSLNFSGSSTSVMMWQAPSIGKDLFSSRMLGNNKNKKY